jgi:hypothetical protein
MKSSLLQYIILYVLVACVALAIATLARMFATSMGFDGFTTFMVFIVVLGIEAIVYLSIHVILQELMLPWIGEGLSKIPYFRNKMNSVSPTNKIAESITEQLSLEDIRNEQLQNRAKEQEEKLNIALDYTRKMFAPYVSDEHIELLCNNLKIYADKLNLETLQPIKTGKILLTIDIFHFGWNVWNHFKISKQIDIAHFLKKVFPEILRDVEVETIKRHLKDDELKGIIKIRESLSTQQ